MKTPENWVIDIAWPAHRTEVAGDICLKRPRPTEGRRADDDDDEQLSYVTN